MNDVGREGGRERGEIERERGKVGGLKRGRGRKIRRGIGV